MSYELQALVEGAWSWLPLASEGIDAEYPTRESAEQARASLLARSDWHESAVRIVDTRGRARQRTRPAKLVTMSPEAWERVDEIARRTGATRSATLEAIVRAATMPRPLPNARNPRARVAPGGQ